MGKRPPSKPSHTKVNGGLPVPPNRIREHRERKGWSQEKLAQLAETSNQQIGRLEKGERDLSPYWLDRLARAIGDIKPDELLPVDFTIWRVKVSGIVQAGYWAEPEEEMERPPVDEYISAPLPDAFRQLRLFAVKVAGLSMNRLYPPGTILICATLEDLHEPPTSGRRYIVRRIAADGRIESTVKEYVVDDRGRSWLWPRSDDPEFQQPWRVDEGRPGETIEIYARVLKVQRDD